MRILYWLSISMLLWSSGVAWAGTDWNGEWETHWAGGGTRLNLVQTGDQVAGQAPQRNEQIQGRAVGRTLEGITGEVGPHGRFSFTLAPDSNSFTGRFANGDWWNGTRATHPDLASLFDDATPQQGFIRFITAGNAARAGADDGWAIAAATLDFDKAAKPLVLSEKIDRARAMFDVIDLTTFNQYDLPTEPPPGANPNGPITINLQQSGSDAQLSVQMHRTTAGHWVLEALSPAEISAARKVLLARYDGRMPAADSFRQLRNPRDTMRAFLEGQADWDHEGHDLALSTMDTSALPALLRQIEAPKIASYLARVIARVGLMGLQSIPNDGTSRTPFVFYAHNAGRIVIAPSGPEADAPWKFTPTTLATVDQLYRAIETTLPPNPTMESLFPRPGFLQLRDFIGRHAPFMLGRGQPVEYWKIAMAVLILTASLLLSYACLRGITAGLARLTGVRTRMPRLVKMALMTAVTLGLMAPVGEVLESGWRVRQFALPVVGSLFVLCTAVVAWTLLGMLGGVLERRTARSVTPTDDIVAFLTLAALKMALVLAASLGVMYLLSIPTSNIVAGLGISGLALAFASRETLSNVFGAGILVADRPFRHGDTIHTHGIDGRVENVGLRSTRVRTSDDSVIVIPNGKLSDSIITNLGTRRFHLISTQVSITAGGTSKTISAFVDAVRALIDSNPDFLAERTDVAVTKISNAGVDVEVTVGLMTANSRSQRQLTHILLLDIVEIAAEHGMQLGNWMAPEKIV